jgi:hypothetical protein
MALKADDINRVRENLALCEAYERLFTSPDGQLVMGDLERRGYMLETTHSAEPGRTEFNEGRRSLVLHIMSMRDPKSRERLMGYLRDGQTEGETKNG